MQVITEWGLSGVKALMKRADVFVVVDVLSFSTCIDIACANGAQVFPFPINDRTAAEAEAKRLGAELAGKRTDAGSKFSLSAPTLRSIPAKTRLVLPSPNGSHISFSAREKVVFAACLRNASAVAETVAKYVGTGTVAVIPAGERWPDGSLRPAIEDFLGAGAVIAELDGNLSPEAMVARDAFLTAKPQLSERIAQSVSGIELHEKGFPQDVDIALELNVSSCVPILTDQAFIGAAKL